MSASGFRICHFIYFHIIAVILLCLSLKIEVQLIYDAFIYYNAVVDNWKQDAMNQLRVSQNVCDQNEQQLILYTWPGSERACDCRYISYSGIAYYFVDDYVPKRELYIGHTCNSTDRHYGCYQIPGTPSKKLKYFSDNYGNQFTFCAQFTKGNNFYLPPSDCQEGKLCGTNKENQFCTKSDVCPIYDFGFGEPPQDAIEQENGFWISRQSEKNLPIINIIAGEGEGMCANPQLLPITKGREDFILMKKIKVDCARDSRFIKTSSTSEIKFYKANDMLSTIKRLIIMEINDKYQWNLYKRPYIPWKSECRGLELQQFLSQGQKQTSILIIWGFICLIVIIADGFYIVLIAHYEDEIFQYEWIIYDKNNEKHCISLCKQEYMLKFIFDLLIIGLIYLSSTQFSDIQDLTQSINAKGCSDKFTNFLLQSLNYKLQSVFIYQTAFIVFFVVQIIVDIVLILIFLINLKKNRDNQYQQLNQQENIPV